MTKQFSLIAGWFLLLVGILNLFLPPIRLWPAHSVLHIIAGMLGVWSAKNAHASRNYAIWVGFSGVALAILGFTGTNSLLGVFDLSPLFNVIHFMLGAWGLWAAFGRNKSSTPAV